MAAAAARGRRTSATTTYPSETAHTRNSGNHGDNPSTDNPTKRCTSCGRTLPLSAFYQYRDKRSNETRHFGQCKRCKAAKDAARRERERATKAVRPHVRNRAGRSGTKRLRGLDNDALVAELRARLFVSEWKQHLDTPPEERRPNDEAFVNILVRTANAPVRRPELVGEYIKAIGTGASA